MSEYFRSIEEKKAAEEMAEKTKEATEIKGKAKELEAIRERFDKDSFSVELPEEIRVSEKEFEETAAVIKKAGRPVLSDRAKNSLFYVDMEEKKESLKDAGHSKEDIARHLNYLDSFKNEMTDQNQIGWQVFNKNKQVEKTFYFRKDGLPEISIYTYDKKGSKTKKCYRRSFRGLKDIQTSISKYSDRDTIAREAHYNAKGYLSSERSFEDVKKWGVVEGINLDEKYYSGDSDGKLKSRKTRCQRYISKESKDKRGESVHERDKRKPIMGSFSLHEAYRSLESHARKSPKDYGQREQTLSTDYDLESNPAENILIEKEEINRTETIGEKLVERPETTIRKWKIE